MPLDVLKTAENFEKLGDNLAEEGNKLQASVRGGRFSASRAQDIAFEIGVKFGQASAYRTAASTLRRFAHKELNAKCGPVEGVAVGAKTRRVA